ncbi:MAG: hypothetical protein Q9215_003185, partial [Flavoplaca cf. flavocitrina]
SPDSVSYPERIKKLLARIATPPSSIIKLPTPIEAPEEEANSTNITTTADPQALSGQGTAATSVLSSQKVFAVQKFYVSPSKPMDKELQDVWCNQIFDRLNQTLRVTIPTGTCLQEFMHLGRRPTALKPTLVINCGDVHVKRQVEKTFKKQIWLQDLLKSRGIMFVALVVKISLSAGPSPSHAKTNDLTEAYAIHLAPFPLTACGSSCFIRVKDGKPHRSCTLGGVIVVNGAAVGLTAGHPFRSFDKHVSSSSNQVTEDPDDSSSDASSEPYVFNEDDDRADDKSSTSSLTLQLDVHDSVEYDDESTGLYVSHQWQWQPSSQVVCSHQIENNSTRNGKMSSNDLDWAILQGLPEAIISLANRQTHPISQFSNMSETTPSGTSASVVINVQGDGPRLGHLHSSASSIKLYTSILKVQLVTLERALPLGSSGGWVTLDNKLCGHIIAVREDVPWAYMIAIRPIFDDIRLRLKTDDVRLPTDGEFLKWARGHQRVSELAGDTASPQQDFCSHAADKHKDPLTDETLTRRKAPSPRLESANPYGSERNRPLYPLRPEHSQLDNVHDVEHISGPHQVVVKERKSKKSPGNPLMNVPVTLFKRAELLGVDYHDSGHGAEPPVSEMEMGRSNFELPSIRREV